MAGVLDIAETALPVVRTADTFVALRPNDRSNEPEELIRGLLFGIVRHLFLVPDDWTGFTPLDNIVVAWNGSRESARALAGSLPFLHQASKVGVLVVESQHQNKNDNLKTDDAVLHLRHHGINAVKYRAVGGENKTADVLIAAVPQPRRKPSGDGQLQPLSTARFASGIDDQPDTASFTGPPAHRALTAVLWIPAR